MSELDTGGTPASSSDKHPQFSYFPLEAGHFRLLQIQSADSNEITCELKHYLIQEAPPYFALSYVWGEGKPDRAITIEGAELSISKHVYEGINTISSFLNREKLQGYLIWIDAICIDQQNLQEKAMQVPLIGDVYKGANIVLLWFGILQSSEEIGSRIVNWCSHFNEIKCYAERKETETAEQCLERQQENQARLESLEQHLEEVGIDKMNLEALYAAISLIDRSRGYESMQKDLRAFRKSAQGKQLLPEDDKSWDHLFAFLSNAWWFRIWTIQEMSLAKDAIILSQDTIFEWDYLASFRERLCTSSAAGALYSPQLQLKPGGPDMDFNSRASLHTIIPKYHLPDGWLVFQYMLLGLRSYRAKVQKDYIYGLLGMLNEDIRSQISIDYTDSITTEFVFSQAVKSACKLENGVRFWARLMVLYDAVPKQLAALPSWVPDFSSDIVAGATNKDIGYHAGPSFTDEVHSRYQHLASMSFSESSCVATVRGLSVDLVESSISTPLILNMQDMMKVDQTIGNSRDVTWGPEMDDHLFRTLAGADLRSWFRQMDSVVLTDESNSEAAPNWFKAFFFEDDQCHLSYHSMRDFVNFIHSHDIKTAAEALSSSAIYSDEKDLTKMARDLLDLRVAMRGRFLFRTAVDRVGISSKRLERGDAICMIPGASLWLHALSADKQRYISAQVSVEGLMGDALLDALPLDESKWEDFHLH